VRRGWRCSSSFLMRLADWGRVTQVMKRVGVRRGRSSVGIEVPLREEVEVVFEGEERMPERIAMPRVP